MSATHLPHRLAARTRRAWLLGAKAALQSCRMAGRRQSPALHVFVSGAQRSGTNMVMDLLERSFETTVYHERDARAFDRYRMRPPAVIDDLVARAPGRIFVIKALCEADRLPELMARYTPAATLWIYRDYADVVRSSLRSFRRVAANVTALVDDPASCDWMGRGMSPATHERLRALHRPGMDEASRVALFWFIRNRLLFDTGLGDDPRIRRVRYEDLLADPDHHLGATFAFLGLAYRPSLGRGVTPPRQRRQQPLDLDPAVRAACEELLAELDLGPAHHAPAACETAS